MGSLNLVLGATELNDSQNYELWCRLYLCNEWHLGDHLAQRTLNFEFQTVRPLKWFKMKRGRESTYKTESSSCYKNLSLSHDEELLILNSGTRWRWSTSRPGVVALPLAKNPDTHWTGGWVGSRPVWPFWRRKKSLANTGIRTLDLPVWFQVRVTRNSDDPKKGLSYFKSLLQSQRIKSSTKDTNYASCYQESLVLAFRSYDKLRSLYSALP